MELLRAGRAETVLPEGDAFALQRLPEPPGHGVPAGAGEDRAVFGEEQWFLPLPGEGGPFHAYVANDGVARDRLHRHKTNPGLGLGSLATVDDEMADRIRLRRKD